MVVSTAAELPPPALGDDGRTKDMVRAKMPEVMASGGIVVVLLRLDNDEVVGLARGRGALLLLLLSSCCSCCFSLSLLDRFDPLFFINQDLPLASFAGAAN